jgi:ribonuclease HI
MDGAFEFKTLTGGTCAVIKSEDGTFLKAMAWQLPLVTSALVAEAEAWRDGLRLLGPSPQQQVILETDLMELITLWRSREDHRLEVTPILKDIQAMTMVYSSFSMIHTRRMGNTAAHICARNASSSHAVVWEGNPPSFLLRQLNEDCNHPDYWMNVLSQKNFILSVFRPTLVIDENLQTSYICLCNLFSNQL